MEEKHFKFKVKLGNIEFEVEGDKAFVEKTMTRYEGRFLPRFQQLMESAQRAASVQANSPAPAEKTKVSSSSPAVELPPIEVAPRLPDKDHEGKNRRDRSRYSRGRKYPRNNSSTWVKPSPTLPKDQELIRKPYGPEGVGASGGDIQEKACEGEEQTSTGESRESVEKEQKSPGKKDYNQLREMFKKLNPRTHHEKILVFAYFLTNRNGYADFSGGDIKECYDAVKADSPGNINQVLNHACRTGFLNKLHGGRQVKYSLTSKGRHFVERGFEPGDRDASS